ncbi:MAG: hypothetical protein C4560_14265 [Nitrospiraceae bacterium]|nr:MAG: hypothetical protein C4560_14265 [Nitrospiraceae bacterium]
MDMANMELLKTGLLNAEYRTRNGDKTEVTNPKSEIRKVAREMESLFVYQLLKVMRESIDASSGDEKGLGSGTYTTLFDMELSKSLSQRGFGLQDSIAKWLERTQVSDTGDANPSGNSDNK